MMREVRAPSDHEIQTVVLKPLRGEGLIQLDISKPDAAEQFVLGATYSVDFTRSD